ELLEPAEVGTGAVAHGCDRNSLDPVGDHLLNGASFEREVAAGITEDQTVVRAARDVLRATDDQREERIRDVRNDQRERARLLPAEPAREPARHVAEIRDGLLDPP